MTRWASTSSTLPVRGKIRTGLFPLRDTDLRSPSVFGGNARQEGSERDATSQGFISMEADLIHPTDSVE